MRLAGRSRFDLWAGIIFGINFTFTGANKLLFSIGLLIVIAYLAYRARPREREEDKHIHGAGQIGLLAALALFGVDYFTSFYYGTGELMSALHPYGLQKLAYYSVALIAFANFIFGALYMYSLGIFNEGGARIPPRCVISSRP